MKWSLALAIAGLGTIAACSGGDPASPGGTGTTAQAVTFHKDVEPILQQHCQSCHVQGGIAPFALVTHDDAKTNAADVVLQTKTRAMPPWGAQDTSECTPPRPWKEDIRLSADQIATLAAWHEAGDPEGDPKDAPPPITPAPATLEGGISLAPAAPYTLTATGDYFRCTVLDPQLATTKYLNGTFFIAGNRTIVHHALAFAIPPGAHTPNDATEYDCFGGSGVTGATLVAAWAPGGVPNEYPADVGLPLEAGTRFVMQIHYHPHANATPDPDRTTFQFRVLDTPPTWLAITRLIGNFSKAYDDTLGFGLDPGPDDPASGPAFTIPPDVSGHTETMRYRVPSTVKGITIHQIGVLGVGAHMHLVGHDEKITVTHADGSSECLLQEPAWNFDWQRGYEYDAPLEMLPMVSPGDVLQMRCTYDNTLQNGALAAALDEQGLTQTQTVTLGESTLDEMCLGAFTFVYKTK